MSTLPRIQYNAINIDFDRGVNVWNMVRDQSRVENESATGIVETLSYFERDRVVIQRRVTSADLQAQLEQFWAYARTGQTFSFWRDRDLAAYWDFEGKSYTSNDAVAGTLTRATVAKYDDPTTGFVTEVTSGTARFPTGKFGRGILLERAATNILLRSEELGNAAWTATNITVTTDTAETTAPDGTNNAERLTATAIDGNLRQDTSTNIGTNDAVLSIYLKTNMPGTTTVTLYIIRADTGATLASSGITVTSEWARYSVTYDNSGTITANWGAKIELDVNASICDAFGTQLEVGANILSKSSYIKTVAASATRNIDVLSYTASNFFDYYPRQCSISFWFAPTWSVEDNNLTRYLFSLQVLNGNTTLHIDASELLQLNVRTNLGTNINAASSAITVSAGTFYFIAVTWDSTASNSAKIYFNGSLIGTSSNSAFAISPRSTNFYIGSDGSAVSCDGIIDDFEIRKDVLTAAQISRRYTSGLAKGWRRNYYSSMLIDQDVYEPALVEGGWRFNLPIVMKEVLT